ncbi:hypothetical protein DLAC_00959 [Tieghemostelium lacteum]|uniref:E3 ubiquitin-protein ligase n=1 Tax=Tieghemostelium lacteum TaxID=361077 RepID=A0A152A7P9_TIELA|nr:hypothetical protein DLAC_00959 [Tieghemostelium lacteum]|eukprot:KYR02155.1 hypothetical protein DLAC_00959 [Tieghemostelium lacteum]
MFRANNNRGGGNGEDDNDHPMHHNDDIEDSDEEMLDDSDDEQVFYMVDEDDEMEEDELYGATYSDHEDYTNDESISEEEEEEEEVIHQQFLENILNKDDSQYIDKDMKNYQHSIKTDKFDLFLNMIKSPQSYTFTETFNESFISYITHSEPFILEKYLAKLRIFFLSMGQKNLYEEIKKTQNVSTCGKVFKMNDWGYQCTTCCLDATSIYCQSCFKDSDHKGHEFKAVRTGAGGCCDCGDKDSILESGFCSKHRDLEESDEDLFKILGQISTGHIETCHKVLGLLLDQICYVLSSKPSQNDIYQNRYPFYSHKTVAGSGQDVWGAMIYNDETHSFDQVTGCLKKFTQCTNQQSFEFAHYVHMNDRCVVYTGSKEEVLKVAKKIQESTLKCTISQRFTLFPILNLKVMLEFFNDLTTLSCFRRIFCNLLRIKPGVFKQATVGPFNNLESESVRLCELMEKIAKLPEESIHLLKDWIFSLTFDRSFKMDFSRCFVKMYPEISKNYVMDIYPYDTSLLSLTVQIFTIPNLSLVLATKYNSLQVIYKALESLVAENSISNNKKIGFDSAVEFDQRRAFKKCQLLISDFHHTLSTKPILKNLLVLGNTSHFTHWLSILNLYHLVNPNVRSTTLYQENEQWSHYFTDYVFLAKNTNTILNSLIPSKNEVDPINDVKALQTAFTTARDAIELIKSHHENQGISFHIPLHRTITQLCLIITQNFPDLISFFIQSLSTSNHNNNNNNNSNNESIGKRLLYGPASIDRLISESNSKMWLKNGIAIVQQIHNYLYHQHLRCYLADFDMFLKQICMVVLGSKQFVSVYLGYYTSIEKLFDQGTKALDSNQMGVLSNFIYNLIVLLTDRSFVGQMSRVELIENDIAHTLMAKPLTHSKLMTCVSPDNRGLNITNEHFEEALSKVSNFLPPSSNEPGRYQLKQEYYSRYNKYYFRFVSGEREKSEDTLNSLGPQFANRLLRIPKLVPLLDQFKEINGIYLCETTYQLIFHSLVQCVECTSLVDEKELDQQDTQQRQIERSDVISHLVHLLYLCIDQTSTSDYSQIINYLLKPYDSTKEYTIVDLLTKILKDQYKTYCHATIKSQLELLSKHSVILLNRLKLLDPEEELFTLDEGQQSIRASRSNLKDSLSPTDDEKEDKKKKAEEARKKILAQFSQQQKSFSTQVLKNSLADIEDDNDDDQDEIEYSTEIKGTCILCRESTPINDKSKPIGSLCNIQFSRITSIMQQREQLNLDPNYYYCGGNSKNLNKDLYVGPIDEPNVTHDTLLNTGVFIKSCGHLMHIQCFQNLYQSASSFVNCPLCGVYSNALLPNEIKNFSPFGSQVDKQKYIESLKGTSLYSLYRDFGDRLNNKLKKISYLETLKAPLSHVVSSTISLLEFYGRSGNRLLSSAIDYKQVQSLKGLFDSVVLVQMLDQGQPIPLSKLEPFDYLVNWIVSKNILDTTEYKSKVVELLNCILIRSVHSYVDRDSKNSRYIVPIGSNSFELLSSSKENLENIQNLIKQQEQINNSVSSSTTTTTTTTSTTSKSNNEVWDKVTSEFIIFLRKVSILESIYFNTTLPSFELQLDMMSNYVDQMIEHIGLPGQLTCQKVLDTLGNGNVRQLIEQEYSEDTKSSKDLYRHLISNSPKQFELVPLAKVYDDMLQLKVKCLKCKSVPSAEDQALCLGCGRMLCLGLRCCRYGNNTNELSLHSQKCIGQQGLYLLIDQCVIIAVYEDVLTTVTTPYLDQHGEEDVGLKRGIPLHFVKERYQHISNTISKHEILVSKTNSFGNFRNQI